MAAPEKWIPLFKESYQILRELLAKKSIEPVAIGAVAYGTWIEPDQTKDIDIGLFNYP